MVQIRANLHLPIWNKNIYVGISKRGFQAGANGIISKIESDKYYVNMMIAWYFATALAKQWNEAIKYFEKPCMNKFCHNKSLQKAIESYRITPEQKEYIRTLKMK